MTVPLTLEDLARATIARADRGNPILPVEARTLALAYLERLGEAVKDRPAARELEHTWEARQTLASGPNGRMGSAHTRVGGSVDPEVARKERDYRLIGPEIIKVGGNVGPKIAR